MAFKGVVVDFGKVEVSRDGISVVLTAHEFKTLQFFVQNPDRLITRAELLKEVCSYISSPSEVFGPGENVTSAMKCGVSPFGFTCRAKSAKGPGQQCGGHLQTM